MKITRKLLAFVLFSILAIFAMPSGAQDKSGAAEMTDGVVRKIDQENSKITIKHDEIKNLEMPPMTMVFQVKNKSLLEKVQVGEAVKFQVIQEGGKFVITDLKPAP